MRSTGLAPSVFSLLLGGFFTFSASVTGLAIESERSLPDDYMIVDSNSLLGSYLAGRIARSLRDNESAARYYREALDKDPNSKEILEEAFQLKVATGDFSEALKLAHELDDRKSDNKVASFFLGIEAFQKKNYAVADKYFEAGGTGPIADLTARLARAWIALQRGQTKTALKLAGQTDAARTRGSQEIEMLHRAMIADLAKRRSTADELYQTLHKNNPKNVRILVAYARHAAHWKGDDLAKSILKPHLELVNPNPLVQSLADDIEAGKNIDLIITSATDGLAEVFQGIGEALTGDGVIDAGQVYLQLALYVQPDHVMAHYALGELYDQIQKYDAAAESFGQVASTNPLWLNAQLRKAYALNSLERIDDAKALLSGLMAKYPNDMRPYYTLGNLLRGNKDYAEAITAYTQAIEKLGPEDRSHWSLYYARGVCYERIKEWQKAEADLQKALALDPDQELALNYLGYSWVDQRINIEKAMQLIRRAVQKRPNDGYFVDSLGWAYFRQNDFAQAVKHLERAVELKPEDPVINDHLGDAYWKVGRQLEANYQWQYALGLEPEPEDEKRLQEKLKSGLVDEPTTRAALEGQGQPSSQTK
jgi:tetratricopeptide (TPR) repeat protein